MNNSLNPRVANVKCLDDYQLEINFSNGEIGRYSVLGILKFGVFAELADVAYFKMARVMNGTISWPNEQDICPDTLYLDSVKISPTR